MGKRKRAEEIKELDAVLEVILNKDGDCSVEVYNSAIQKLLVLMKNDESGKEVVKRMEKGKWVMGHMGVEELKKELEPVFARISEKDATAVEGKPSQVKQIEILPSQDSWAINIDQQEIAGPNMRWMRSQTFKRRLVSHTQTTSDTSQQGAPNVVSWKRWLLSKVGKRVDKYIFHISAGLIILIIWAIYSKSHHAK